MLSLIVQVIHAKRSPAVTSIIMADYGERRVRPSESARYKK